MAAANTDKLCKVGAPGSVTTLAAPGHLIGGTSLTVVSTTNWETTTGVVFAMDTVSIVNGEEVRDVGTYTEWIGVVAGATSITNMTLLYGSDQNYPAGSTSRVYIPVTSSRENRLVDGLLVEHKQTGAHEAITADSIVIADAGTIEVDTINEATSAAGVTIDSLLIKDGKLATDDSVVASNLTDAIVKNVHLDTTAGEPGGAWLAWTPTFANFTKDTSTIVAEYTQIGKTIHYRLSVTLAGASVAMGTAPTFTLPVTSVATPQINTPIGSLTMKDANGPTILGSITWASTTTGMLRYTDASATYVTLGNPTASVPFTWAATDSFNCSGTYEAA